MSLLPRTYSQECTISVSVENHYFRSMQVLLTFDYELFFGPETGSVRKCMLEPTEALLRLSRQYDVPMTFFVDVGYVLQLERLAPHYPELQNDLNAVKAQMDDIQRAGSDIQLHIHPHWERASYDGSRWQIVTDGCYKLDDFPDEELATIVRTYHAALVRLTGKSVHSYRAGGWCIQPFSRVKKVFADLGIVRDSSVFPGGAFSSRHYDFDFTRVPRFTGPYPFNDDVCVADETGAFTEYPIASWEYHPLFYWQLYVRGRLSPASHKMIGDGTFLAQPGRKQSVLTRRTWNHVSADGFYAGMLGKQARFYQRKGVSHFVVIGHPKGLTVYALKKLEAFLKHHQNKYRFTTFSDLA